MSVRLKKLTLKANVKNKKEKDTSVASKPRHLETVEAERILLIIDDTIKNCCLVASIDTILSDLEEFSMLLGHQLYALFKNFGDMYKEYTSTCMKILAANGEIYNVCLDLENEEQRDTYILPENFWTASLHELKSSELNSVKSSPLFTEDEIETFKENLPELENEIDKMRPQIQFFIRSILIAFRQNPIATKCILDHKLIWKIKRNVSLANLINYLEKLREILLQRLLTSPQEKDERARFLATVDRKNKQHQTVIKDLRSILEKMKIEKEKMVCQMNSEIMKLQREIYELEIDGKNELHKLRVQTEKEIEEITETHAVTKENLLRDLSEIKSRYNELVERNKENELSVRRRKWKLETETEGWINKYDSEMADYQLQYDKLKSDYDSDMKALAELQTRFEPLEKEYLQVLEERRIAKEKQEAERSEHEALVYWATVIQSFWRAWKARKAMRRNRRR